MCNKGGGVATTPEAVWRILRDAPFNLADYFRTCSYGKTLLDLSSAVVVGPLTMPCNGTGSLLAGNWTVTSCHGTNPYGWFSWVEDHATNKLKINLDKFNHRVMIMPKAHTSFQESDCGWAGISTTGPLFPSFLDPYQYGYGYTWIAGDTWDSMWLWFHELGHSLWLQHATSPGAEYGDISSAMGSNRATGLRCYNAPQVWQLGWGSPFVLLRREDLSAGKTVLRWLPSANSSADHSMRIYLAPSFSLDDPSGVPLSCTRQLWVSYRAAYGKYEMLFKEAGMGAVFVHWWDGYAFSAINKPQVLATLKVPNGKTPVEAQDTSFELPMCRIVITPLDEWDGYALVGVCVKTSDSDEETDCSNGLDDDCDGLVDAKDPDCINPGGNKGLQTKRPPPPAVASANEDEEDVLVQQTAPGLIFEGLLHLIQSKNSKDPPSPPPLARTTSGKQAKQPPPPRSPPPPRPPPPPSPKPPPSPTGRSTSGATTTTTTSSGSGSGSGAKGRSPPPPVPSPSKATGRASKGKRRSILLEP